MTNLFLYFSASTTLTIAGLMFYMATENLQPAGDAQARRKQIILCIVLSVLFTPLGAWFLSAILRMRRLPPVA